LQKGQGELENVNVNIKLYKKGKITMYKKGNIIEWLEMEI